jgi:hypothetical protein
LVESWLTVPATGALPGPISVKLAALMVAGFIAWPKVAATTVVGHTPAAPFGGVTETGAAGAWQVFAPVANIHAWFAARLFPNRSCTPVVIVAVYVVFSGRLADGLKYAVSFPAL